jgi:hypothetical protein
MREPGVKARRPKLMRRAFLWLVWLLPLLVVAACSPGASRDAAMSAPARTLSFHRFGLAFRYPAAWPAKTKPAFDTSQSMVIAYLTASRLHDPCQIRKIPLGTEGTCQGNALSALPPGGAFVTWQVEGVPLGSPLKGSRQAIDGHLAIVSRNPIFCGGLGADASIAAAIRKSQGNWYVMTACLRGPGLRQAETAVSAMLHSVHLTDA